MKNFYLAIRRCVLHPSTASLHPSIAEVYPEVKDYSGYRSVPSAKLEALVEIIKHHLATDGAPGMKPSRQRDQEYFLSAEEMSRSPPPSRPASPDPLPTPHDQAQNTQNQSRPPQDQPQDQSTEQDTQQQRGGAVADKIIVYSYFVSSLNLLKVVSRCAGMPGYGMLNLMQVLNHNNIKFIAITGEQKQGERVKNLEKFKNSGRDGPRVLVVSNVAALGLNIAFANILVILVRAREAA